MESVIFSEKPLFLFPGQCFHCVIIIQIIKSFLVLFYSRQRCKPPVFPDRRNDMLYHFSSNPILPFLSEKRYQVMYWTLEQFLRPANFSAGYGLHSDTLSPVFPAELPRKKNRSTMRPSYLQELSPCWSPDAGP